MVVQERLTHEPLPQIFTAVESLGFEQTEDAPIETLYQTVGSRQKIVIEGSKTICYCAGMRVVCSR